MQRISVTVLSVQDTDFTFIYAEVNIPYFRILGYPWTVKNKLLDCRTLGDPGRCASKTEALLNHGSTFSWPSPLIIAELNSLSTHKLHTITHTLNITMQICHDSYMDMYIYTYTYLWSTQNHTHVYIHTYICSNLLMCVLLGTYAYS